MVLTVENARRPSTLSVVSATRRWPSNQTMYPVSAVFGNSTMRSTRKVLHQRCAFALAAVCMITLVSAVYVFITLPMQGMYRIHSLSSAERDELDPYALVDDDRVHPHGARNSYALVQAQRSILRERLTATEDSADGEEMVDSTTIKEQGFFSYVRLVQGLRDLNDFLAEASRSKQLSQEAIIAHALRYTRSLEKAADQVEEQCTHHRARESIAQLSQNVWGALEQLQFPKNCSEAHAILCDLTNPHGFASGMADVLHCLVRGLQLNRTVILRTTDWHYTRDLKWNQVFEPLSGCKEDQVKQPIEKGYPETWNVERRHMARLPNVIAQDLVAFHGDPYAWFHGELMSYALRPTKGFEKEVERHIRSMFPDDNYIAMHIRRSDKNYEANFRDLDLYMRYAEEYFRREALRTSVSVKRVFVATDDVGVVETLRRSYPTFEFFSNPKAAREASKLGTRDSKEAFKNVLLDLHTLSRSQHLICTMSSGFSRVAYELMQHRYFDAWRRMSSLDIDYIYAYAFFPERLPFEPADGLVLPKEVTASRVPIEAGKSVTDSYKLAAQYVVSWSKRASGPNGLAPTHDMANVVAKFKTEQPVRSARYGAHIDPLKDESRTR